MLSATKKYSAAKVDIDSETEKECRKEKIIRTSFLVSLNEIPMLPMKNYLIRKPTKRHTQTYIQGFKHVKWRRQYKKKQSVQSQTQIVMPNMPFAECRSFDCDTTKTGAHNVSIVLLAVENRAGTVIWLATTEKKKSHLF